MNMDITEIWDKTLVSIQSNISSPVSYNVHIKVSEPVSLVSSVFTISVPTSITKNIIEFRHKNLIENSLEKVTGQKLSLNIIVGDEEDIQTSKNNNLSYNETTDYGVNPKYTFDNFVVGSSNEFASAAALKVAEAPGKIYNPLFIYGKSGLGKTHLMQAIGNKIKENNSSSKILYVDGEKFTNEFITSVRENTTESFRKKYREQDVLLVDDVQFIENKEATQEEFFHTFNELFNYNKQIVLTSDRKPSDLTTLTDRLRTRFGQGLIIDISIPNYETRVAILQKKAQSYNIEIDEEIFEYIAENIRSSVRELEGALIQITSMSEIKKCDITLDFVKKTLEPIISGNNLFKITPKTIIQKTAFYYNISENDIMGKIKTKNIAVPRQVAMYLCRKLLSMSDTAISREFGKDRSTVNSNIMKIEDELKTNDSLNSDISYITKDIESK